MNNSINFRDCGGYVTAGGKTVKTGMIYRSASLDRLNGKNRLLVENCHLSTIIDLRPSEERFGTVTGLSGVQRLTLPLDVDRIARERIQPNLFKRNGEELVQKAITSVYRDIVSLAAPSIRKLFSWVTSADFYPLCINCRAGKDRTGFAVALILRTLGVTDSDIIKDYLTTNEFILPRIRRFTVPLKVLSLSLFPAAAFDATLTARREYLETAFSRIDTEFGGMEGYLDFCEVPLSLRERLRTILL
ncbi:MAG: tyrosine-protein phosphatase [Chitinispirillaceae bacterium]|nr:tyrosine-protein phosphatase [Chitinispirillaceae bacterium]